MGIAIALANVSSWELEDAEAYWNAALRLRDGADLYVAVPTGADETIAYRYAPWLAWAWVPLTYLPKPLVQAGWSLVLVASVVVALVPLARVRTVAAVCLLFLLGGLLIRTASTGNVHALLIAMLVWGTRRHSGPVWIGVAASLKIAPILYALVFLGRRQWGRVVVAVVVAGVLWLPAVLYGLSDYPVGGSELSIVTVAGPFVWVALVAMLVVAALILARTRYAWLSASCAVIAAVPRVDLYALTYLLVGQPDREPRTEVAGPSGHSDGAPTHLD
jgi:hypothetical protein